MKEARTLDWAQNKPCIGNVNFNNHAFLELFAFPQNILNRYIVAFNFNVNDVFKLGFPV